MASIESQRTGPHPIQDETQYKARILPHVLLHADRLRSETLGKTRDFTKCAILDEIVPRRVPGNARFMFT
jgi:hypothetical protein